VPCLACGVPVEFLTDHDVAGYGQFNGAPSKADLDRAFFLDDEDKALIKKRRGDHNQLGFGLQLTTVRHLGMFLVDPLNVPTAVVDYLAEQLEIADPSQAKRYGERRTTRFEHADEIKAVCGLREFADAEAALAVWVGARAWTTGDGPKAIFFDSVDWLRSESVLLPGVTTLARLVSRVRDEATQRLWDRVSGVLSFDQRAALEALLIVPCGARVSDLERWRQGPTKPSGRSLEKALHRVSEIAGDAPMDVKRPEQDRSSLGVAAETRVR